MENCTPSEKKPNEWLEEAASIAKKKAASGDPDALYIMYELTADRNWLEKSANAGNSTAQYRMAIGDRQGEGYILPWKRQQTVEGWFLAAAKNGNPKAMMQLFGIYREKGDFEQARYWLEQSALLGYEAGLYNLGYFLAVEPEKLGFPMDKVKGYGLISLLKVLDGGGAAKTDVEEILPQIESTMTSSELEQAKIFAENWKKEHPPISYFPDKIRF
ncbi:sel1 repeat family protein [Pseudomonas syringae]|nr:sel1 repeat family protein [Pseudomonas syringae]